MARRCCPIGFEQSQHDVDVIALGGGDTRAHPFPEALTEAVGRVARELDLAANWLNNSMSLTPWPGPVAGIDLVECRHPHLRFPDGLKQVMVDDFHDGAVRGSPFVGPRLLKAIKRFPTVPCLKNYLVVAYTVRNQKEQAAAATETLLEAHPDYLFGRAMAATMRIRKGLLAEALDLLGPRLRLRDLYPETPVFHISEVRAYYHAAGMYYLAVGDEAACQGIIEALQQLVPDAPEVTSLLRELANKRIGDLRQRMDEFDDDEFTGPLNALHFLAEIKASEVLETVLEFFSQHSELLEMWLGESSFRELLYPYAESSLNRLAEWIKQPGRSSIARDGVVEAVARLALRDPSRRAEVIPWFAELLEFFAASPPEHNILDTEVISMLERPEVASSQPAEPSAGRNDPCPCGSGRKFKKCCM